MGNIRNTLDANQSSSDVEYKDYSKIATSMSRLYFVVGGEFDSDIYFDVLCSQMSPDMTKFHIYFHNGIIEGDTTSVTELGNGGTFNLNTESTKAGIIGYSIPSYNQSSDINKIIYDGVELEQYGLIK